MDPCKKHEPRVINHDMIAKCLEEQGLKGEMGRLAREEGIPWEEVLHIRLEFMNILRIDHVWVLPALTKLSLSNNFIEEIENLKTLVNLQELDLSFNKIKKIQNINELVKLQILNLYNNLIESIENMDMLTELTIFSIGENNITNKNNVLHLRRFKHLISVNMARNPMAEERDFRTFVATFLPQIIYYEYKMIDDAEREKGQELYEHQLIELEAVECVVREQQQKIEAEMAEAELHSESFVEFLGTRHLFEQMFENDEEGNLLLKMGDEAVGYCAEYEQQFLALTTQVFETGQEMYLVRKAEVEQFFKVTEGAKVKNQEESIEYMEEFMVIKDSTLKRIKKEKDIMASKDYNKYIGEYNRIIYDLRQEYHEDIHKTWKKLMGREVTLFEQLEETNQNFEQNLTEMVNSFIEMANGIFAQIRTLQGTYSEMIAEMAIRYITTLNITPDMVIPPELVPMFSDRDTLNNALGGSHDLHLLIIDNREDRLVHRARSWLSNLVNDLQKNEITRDRSKILEINHYLDLQKEEFEETAFVLEPVTDL